MKTLIDFVIDPIALPRWVFEFKATHWQRAGSKYTDVTLLIGKWQVYVSLRGHHFTTL